MTALSPADRSTVAKLLNLIGSDHDGEALTAARKAHQLVQERGETWPEVLGIGEAPPELPPEPEHLSLARDLLGRGKGIITRWERDFLVGIMSFKTLLPKQQSSLDGIREKLDAATPIA